MKILTVALLLLMLTGCSGLPIYPPGYHASIAAGEEPLTWEAYNAKFGGSPGIFTGYSGYIPAQPGGIHRYGMDQATGPVINGVHYGIPAGPPRVTCYGAILNGQCTGPQF